MPVLIVFNVHGIKPVFYRISIYYNDLGLIPGLFLFCHTSCKISTGKKH